MSKLKIAVPLLVVLTCLSACGHQVVEFKRDADVNVAGDGGRSDGATDPDDAARGDAMVVDGGLGSDGGLAIAPVVTATIPADGTVAPAGDSLFATFSKPMDPDTINDLTFTVLQGTTVVDGTVTWNAQNNTAMFDPTVALLPSTPYAATITTGATDLDGVALAMSHTFAFTTAATPTAPRVVFTTPLDHSSNVAVTTWPIAIFSRPMAAATINASTFVVRQGVNQVPGVVSYNGATNTATFSPSAALAHDVVYTATVTTGAEDSTGLALAEDYSWGFSTTTRPRVTSTLPVPGAPAVPTNDSLFATFSRPMDPSTINALTFTVMRGAIALEGEVSWNFLNNTASFNPTLSLVPVTPHTATITTGARDSSGLSLATSYTWTFTSAATAAAPRVALSAPLDGATDVAVTTRPTAIFSGAMNPATINGATFTVTQGVTPVPGVVTYNSATNTATFSPSSVLGPNLVYTVTVTTGATDTAGLALAANSSWSFTTAARPSVASTLPTTGASAVPPNNSVFATFSKAMDAATITAQTFSLQQGVVAVPGVVTLNAATNTATFNPTASLLLSTTYTATISTGARDTGGLSLAASHSWTFTTAATLAAPTVAFTTPLSNATNVATSANVMATFSQAMNAATINALTFTVRRGLTLVPGVVTYNAATNTATFNPTQALEPNLRYTATLTTGARDTADRPLLLEYSWQFDTSVCTQLPVDLRSAANFVVLAGSTVTNSGPTSVTGDLGTSPGTAITGFLPGIVIGATHAGTPTSAQGIADLTTAYNDAAGRVLCPVTVSGNLGGMTLAPGLYKSTSSLGISSGDLTLDAQGNADAIFIFQMASTLTTSPGRQVVLTNGAKSANVYWQVGTSATLGTTTIFHGTIMADQAITLNTGATLNGRALARVAAVALASNVIVKPTP